MGEATGGVFTLLARVCVCEGMLERECVCVVTGLTQGENVCTVCVFVCTEKGGCVCPV